ncbi:hypothetical protein AB0H60_11075 [Nocardia rhamnosiphila]
MATPTDNTAAPQSIRDPDVAVIVERAQLLSQRPPSPRVRAHRERGRP